MQQKLEESKSELAKANEVLKCIERQRKIENMYRKLDPIVHLGGSGLALLALLTCFLTLLLKK